MKYTIAQNVSKKNTFKTLCICQKPSMNRNCCLIVFFCIYVIQWYLESCKMLCTWKKKWCLKKKRDGQSEAPYNHRVLSTSTCDLEECLRPYGYVQHLHTLLCLLVVTSKPNFYFQEKLVNNYMYISMKFCMFAHPRPRISTCN